MAWQFDSGGPLHTAVGTDPNSDHIGPVSGRKQASLCAGFGGGIVCESQYHAEGAGRAGAKRADLQPENFGKICNGG